MADLRGKLNFNEPMSSKTSWRVGGTADRFYKPADLSDLQAYLASTASDDSVFCVGLGSNLLVRDGGIRGSVVSMHGVLQAIEKQSDGRIYAEAGVHCARLAGFCADAGLAGATFLTGIPGTLGGALAMNAGAHGGETWQRVEWVEVLDPAGKLHRLESSDFEIGYRHVKAPIDGAIYVAALLRFDVSSGRDLHAEIRQFIQQRKATQPVGKPTCGSVFRNPENDYAARLIESCGLKGAMCGDAQVSEKHANFIVNCGSATAADIENLIEQVHATVLAQHGVDMVREVRIVGEASCH